MRVVVRQVFYCITNVDYIRRISFNLTVARMSVCVQLVSRWTFAPIMSTMVNAYMCAATVVMLACVVFWKRNKKNDYKYEHDATSGVIFINGDTLLPSALNISSQIHQLLLASFPI